MRTLLTKQTSTITELKRSPAQLLESANGQPVAILNHNEPVAYLVPVEAVQGIGAPTREETAAALKTVLAKNAGIIKALGDR